MGCGLKWHAGESCANVKKDDGKEDFLKYLEETGAKQCPFPGCGQAVIRRVDVAGCITIDTCPCGKAWCYRCLKPAPVECTCIPAKYKA